MLPDFPDAKDRARRAFVAGVRKRIGSHEPLLAELAHHRIHEGRKARLRRQDSSEEEVEFKLSSAEMELPREQMKTITMDELIAHIDVVAAQLAGNQMQLLLTTVSAAVGKVGNSVSAKELGNKEAFLEMNRRIEVDFDPETLEPKYPTIVLHPSQLDSFVAQIKEWEADPEFRAELETIKNRQLEAWRAREDRRKLVD